MGTILVLGNVCIRSYPRGLRYKVLYAEAPPRGPTPYPFIYHSDRKGSPFTYLLKNTVTAATGPLLWINLRKRRKPSCLFHIVLNKLNDTAIRCVCSLKKKLDNRFPYLFRYLNLWNPYRFICLKPEKDIRTPLTQTLSETSNDDKGDKFIINL